MKKPITKKVKYRELLTMMFIYLLTRYIVLHCRFQTVVPKKLFQQQTFGQSANSAGKEQRIQDLSAD